MGKYRVVVESRAVKDLRHHHKSGNRAVIRRIEQIFAELAEHPEHGVGQPERLRHALSGYWSRRIDLQHRIIYRIDDEVVEVVVISAAGHYTI